MRVLPISVILNLILPLAAAAQGSSYLRAPEAFQIYRNPELGLSLRYPFGLNKEDSANVAGFERAVFALHPEADPTHTGSDPCAPLILTLGSGVDLPPETVTKGKTTINPRGTLTLSEIKRECLDKDVLDDTTLIALVGRTATAENMRPLTRTTNTFIQNTTVWTATALGYGKDRKGVRSPAGGLKILGTIGAVVNGHMLLWTITANDPELFNRMINLSACFDSPNCASGYANLLDFKLNTNPNSSEIATH
jgi:hypothetical protein